MMNILMIDDEAAARRAIGARIQQAGHRCITAATAEEGIALARSRSEAIDVAFVDCWMPGSSGFESLRQLQKIRPEMPVVLLSGMGTPTTEREALRRGAFRFLDKSRLEWELDPVIAAACAEAERRRHTIETVGPAADAKRGSILVVDDHAAFRSALSRALRMNGFSTREVGNASAAVAEWQHGGFDTALIDIHLPDADGIAASRIIHENDPSAVVALMSGEADRSERTAGLADSAIGCIDKAHGIEHIARVADYVVTEARRARKNAAAAAEWKTLPLRTRMLRRTRRGMARLAMKSRERETRIGASALVCAVLIALGLMHGMTAMEQIPLDAGRASEPTLAEMYTELKGYMDRDEAREVGSGQNVSRLMVPVRP